MGRELKRVPIDFDAPLNKVWHGYINPHYKSCPDCKNGYTDARIRLQALVRLIMLSGSDSIKSKNHPYFDHMDLFISGFDNHPGKDMHELTSGFAERDASFCGHDGCDNWSAEKKIIQAAGLDCDKWGICQTCNGEAIDPRCKEKYEAWLDFEPPIGDGYQMWETTSEGSPSSPVFATLESLCEWCADNATTFADFKATKEKWMKMLGDGFVSHQEGNAIFI